jgi:hypothetical protein
MEDDLKKNKNGGRPPKNKKMEDDLKKNKTIIFFLFLLNLK